MYISQVLYAYFCSNLTLYNDYAVYIMYYQNQYKTEFNYYIRIWFYQLTITDVCVVLVGIYMFNTLYIAGRSRSYTNMKYLCAF